MEFVTIADLNNDVINNLYKIPRDVDLIVGIPRSGLFVASIIALYLNKPLTDIDSFVENKIYNVGNTKNNNSNIKEANEAKKILVVDDSLNSGLSMEQARLKLKKFEENKKILYLAGYIKSAKKNSIDIFFRVINDNRLFEWNYMHHTMLEEVCCDIDGVLCENPSDEENDDGEKYINFILNAKPKLVPTRGIGCLVTSRLEKYRKETEIWLKNNHIILDLFLIFYKLFVIVLLLLQHHSYRKIWKKVLFSFLRLLV